jgi:hypothetical protein
MVSRGRRRTVDRSQAVKYRNVGSALLRSAQDLEEVAGDDARYGNAISVIAIHAAIAYNDAITIAHAGFKSTEGEHQKAPDALLAALKQPSPAHVDLLRAVLKKKDAVSYQGEYQTMADAVAILRRAERFCAWAEEMYQHRPPA